MGSPTDAPVRNKTVFKKRALRPWQPTILESMEDAQNSDEVSSKFQEKQIEIIQKQLETTLEIKNRERSELSQTLSTIDDHRITLGGFLRPKDILLVTEQSSLHKTSSLMNELKEKEQEIIEITQNLKISQAEELAKRAESARLVEEKARQAAEEKAIYALRQAQQSAEQCKAAEEQAMMLEQIRSKLEQAVYELEDQVKLSHHELQVREQRIQGEIEHRHKIEQAAAEQYQWFDNEVKTLNQKLKEEFQIKQGHETKISALSIDLENERNTKLQLEADLKSSLAQSAEIDSLLKHEKEVTSGLEQNLLDLQERIEMLETERTRLLVSIQISEDKQSDMRLQMGKMTEVINAERNLRQLFEENLRQAKIKIEKLELRRRGEIEARKLAEDKAKHTFEQAGKAMLQLHHAYNWEVKR